MKSKMSMIDHYLKAHDMAMATVEKKARAILSKHPNLDEFIMAMGRWNFTYKTESDSYYGQPKYMKGLDKFINEWDDVLKLTGDPVRFTAIGETRKDW